MLTDFPSRVAGMVSESPGQVAQTRKGRTAGPPVQRKRKSVLGRTGFHVGRPAQPYGRGRAEPTAGQPAVHDAGRHGPGHGRHRTREPSSPARRSPSPPSPAAATGRGGDGGRVARPPPPPPSRQRRRPVAATAVVAGSVVRGRGRHGTATPAAPAQQRGRRISVSRTEIAARHGHHSAGAVVRAIRPEQRRELVTARRSAASADHLPSAATGGRAHDPSPSSVRRGVPPASPRCRCRSGVPAPPTATAPLQQPAGQHGHGRGRHASVRRGRHAFAARTALVVVHVVGVAAPAATVRTVVAP